MLSATPVEDDYRQLWNQLDMFGTKVTIALTVELLQLAQFFCERHLGQQRVDARFDVGGLLRACGRGSQQAK
jgi:hypothetical protein